MAKLPPNLQEVTEKVRTTIPEDWTLEFVNYKNLGKGERFSFISKKGSPFLESFQFRAIFVTIQGEKTSLIVQDEPSLEKEYEAVRRSMDTIRKDSASYFNVLITLLSASMVGLGLGYGQTSILVVVFISLMYIMNLYFKQILFAKRVRLKELEKVLGYEQLTIVAISTKKWLISNTSNLVFVFFILAILIGIAWNFFI